MGTRHLILVYYKGQYLIAQYGQWDGFPDGQGVTIVRFIRDPDNVAKLRAVLDRADTMLYEPTEAQVDAWNAAEGEVHPAPSLSRDTGAKILELVANATVPVPLFRSIDFLTDGLFCEWAYVVDLDEDVVEVYNNGSDGDQERAWERFKGVEGLENATYLPSMVGSWKFEELPDEVTFVDSCFEG
ncbi:hypothetical protein C8Q74DRAFT_1236298 [Fomes fomentarius]|nr:hypothetical protein C8Q74DRAFT_1236298 [Fomes fomentarius]